MAVKGKHCRVTEDIAGNTIGELLLLLLREQRQDLKQGRKNDRITKNNHIVFEHRFDSDRVKRRTPRNGDIQGSYPSGFY